MGEFCTFPLILQWSQQDQLFLVEGVITIGLAIMFAFILPNSIRKLRGFSQQEKDWVLWNYESDSG